MVGLYIDIHRLLLCIDLFLCTCTCYVCVCIDISIVHAYMHILLFINFSLLFFFHPLTPPSFWSSYSPTLLSYLTSELPASRFTYTFDNLKHFLIAHWSAQVVGSWGPGGIGWASGVLIITLHSPLQPWGRLVSSAWFQHADHRQASHLARIEWTKLMINLFSLASSLRPTNILAETVNEHQWARDVVGREPFFPPPENLFLLLCLLKLLYPQSPHLFHLNCPLAAQVSFGQMLSLCMSQMKSCFLSFLMLVFWSSASFLSSFF